MRRLLIVVLGAVLLMGCRDKEADSSPKLHMSGGDTTEQRLREQIRADSNLANDCAAFFATPTLYLAGQVSPDYPDDLRGLVIMKEECDRFLVTPP